jgi:hypothetical protein
MLPKSLKEELKELKSIELQKRKDLTNEELKEEIKKVNEIKVETKTKKQKNG